jgi:TonB family protein
VPDLATEFPDLPSLQEPKQTPKAEATPEKAEPAKKAEPPAKPKRPTPDQLALSPPRTSPGGSPSRSSSFSRPPGITRSGQNDDFARGVIRALRQTMPPPRGIFGRVTVRLFLNDNGDLAEVRVIESSGIGGLDQSVVFATKQTNFPLPPYGATVADRTFMISYVYN